MTGRMLLSAIVLIVPAAMAAAGREPADGTVRAATPMISVDASSIHPA